MSHNMNTTGRAGYLTLLGLVLVVMMSSGCCMQKRFGGAKAYVPVKETAREQYLHAVQFRNSRNLQLISEKKKLKKAREVVKQVYRKVPEYFPEDRKHTPLALLDLAQMKANIDTKRLDASKACVKSAIKDIEDLMVDYSEFEQLQANALYTMGNCYKYIGDFENAADCFLAVKENYEESTDPLLQDLVKRATFLYNQTYVGE